MKAGERVELKLLKRQRAQCISMDLWYLTIFKLKHIFCTGSSFTLVALVVVSGIGRPFAWLYFLGLVSLGSSRFLQPTAMTSERVARMLSPVTTPTSVTIFGSPGLANHHQPSISDSFVQPLSQPSNHVSTWFNIYKTSIFPAFFHIFPSIFQPLITLNDGGILAARSVGAPWAPSAMASCGSVIWTHAPTNCQGSSDDFPQGFPTVFFGGDGPWQYLKNARKIMGISYWLVVWKCLEHEFYFSIYIYILGINISPNWRIFFRGVETTNQNTIYCEFTMKDMEKMIEMLISPTLGMEVHRVPK